jgi:hypothetical protein
VRVGVAEAGVTVLRTGKTGVLISRGPLLNAARFYDECKRRYSLKLWKAFNMVFNCLPIAAIVSSCPRFLLASTPVCPVTPSFERAACKHSRARPCYTP